MYAKKTLLAVVPIFLGAYADVQLESDKVPSACTSICAPIVELTSLCQVELEGDNTDHTESLLEAQCVCTNDSFSVSSIASTCAACIYASNSSTTSDDDDVETEDIDDILFTCGWSRGSWSTASATQASGITVKATAPTASSQLTTTIVPGAMNAVSSSSSSSSSSSTRGTSTSRSSSTSTENVITSTTTITSTTEEENDDENGASSLAPMGLAGAVVALAAVVFI